MKSVTTDLNMSAKQSYPMDGVSIWKQISTSGWSTPGLIGLVCLTLLAASYERGRGHLHRLAAVVIPPPVLAPDAAGPGGQEPIQLTRSATSNGATPEFLSVTLLPGRGLQLLQIRAAIPGHGDVPLLVSPTVADATKMLVGTGTDANGMLSSTLGGSFEAPWSGQLRGNQTSTPGLLETWWNGQRLTFPAGGYAEVSSVQGLMLESVSSSIKTSLSPDGQSLQAVFRPGTFRGMWPSSLEVTIGVELSGSDVDLTMTAVNTGNKAVPFGAGWHPYFAIPSGQRPEVQLALPSDEVDKIDRATGLPTGQPTTVTGSPLDFREDHGMRLGSTDVDETYVNLQKNPNDPGPICEMRDPGYNYSLQLIPMTSNITRLRVKAPLDKPWVSISPGTNGDDPLGPEWSSPADSGMMVLQPGASTTWKVRLRISAPVTANVGTPGF